MEPNQMSISQWMKYFNRIDNSAPVAKNWNHRPSNYSHQFNKSSGQFSHQNYNDPRSKNLYSNGIKPINNQFGTTNPFKYNNNFNSMTTNFFPNNSNFSSFDNSNLNDFGSMFDNNFNFNNLPTQNWMDDMNYDQILNQKKKKKKDYSNRPIVFIANIDDYRNGSRDDYETDDSEYDDYDSDYDDSEYEDDNQDDYYESQKRPSHKIPYRR